MNVNESYFSILVVKTHLISFIIPLQPWIDLILHGEYEQPDSSMSKQQTSIDE